MDTDQTHECPGCGRVKYHEEGCSFSPTNNTIREKKPLDEKVYELLEKVPVLLYDNGKATEATLFDYVDDSYQNREKGNDEVGVVLADRLLTLFQSLLKEERERTEKLGQDKIRSELAIFLKEHPMKNEQGNWVILISDRLARELLASLTNDTTQEKL